MVAPRLRALLFAGLSTFSLASQASYGLPMGGKPSIENTQYARAIVSGSIARVDELIARVFGGGGGRPEEWPTPPQEGQPSYPGPDGGMPSGRPYPPILHMTDDHQELEIQDDVATDDQLENDKVAGYALQGLGVGLRCLGELIDQANANYYSPAFGAYWGQVCGKAAFLISATQGGKVSAALPLQGLITPQDFALTEQELYQVRSLFQCQ